MTANNTPPPASFQGIHYDTDSNQYMRWNGTAFEPLFSPKWNLFIDDIRDNLDVSLSPGWMGVDLRIARTCDEAISLLESNGLPERISFDHDLGEDTPPATMVMWHLIHGHLDGRWDCSQIKEIMIHSVNGPGANNLLHLWRGFCSEFDIKMDLSWKPALK